ncbi:hypothetical protein BJ170DRAFT_687952 [Xylariales sp. AK1849]|nr:hypothetical protein BJ170DRAFT_687952 [Xylariales sp. AK1849]
MSAMRHLYRQWNFRGVSILLDLSEWGGDERWHSIMLIAAISEVCGLVTTIYFLEALESRVK